jgi:high-affinity iron transporter
MLINAVVIVLREVLEASLIMSLFLAYSQRFTFSRLWLLIAIIVGFACAWAYAEHIHSISNWFEGVGQEVMNAGIQLLIFLILVGFITQSLFGEQHPAHRHRLITLMTMGIILASVREGCEIILFLSGFASSVDAFQTVLIGGAIGTGIGISVGVCIYYALVNLSFSKAAKIGYLLTLLIAAAMVSQVIQQLIQADWVMSQYPLWDTSEWISERSITGQMLYALLGYEATPTPIQAAAYLIAIVFTLAASYLSLRLKKQHHEQ